uniref:Uncharacterized protein n=1 Tax=Oryza rufipogon TaxID=4529 RepID=A0A0E0QWU7_ORYRU
MAEEEEEGEVPFELAQMTPYESGHAVPRAIVAMACPYPATIIPHASWLPRKKASNISPAATAHGAVQQPVHHNSATGASLPVSICNTLDKAIDRFIDPPERRPLVDPQRVLSGNFKHREAGVPVFPNFIAGFQGVAGLARMAVMFARALAGQISMNMGFGLANTSILFFAKHLYALCESDLPYTMCINPATGEVTTLSRCDFDGRRMIGMTAHPKKDPPFLTYIWFDKAGNKADDVPIFSLQQPSMLHDFAITEHYAIFPESQLVMCPMNMALRGGSLIGLDSAMVQRIGVLPRYAKDESEMRWFKVPGFNMLHTANAWEEANGEEIILVSTNNLSVTHAWRHGTHASSG